MTVAGLALLLAAGARAEAGEPGRTARFENWSCRDVLVSATAGAAQSGKANSAKNGRGHSRSRQRFSAREILDLNFDVVLARRVAAGSVLKLDLFTPNGHLYQSFDVPVAEPESGEQVRPVRGYPFALRVSKSRREAERDESDSGRSRDAASRRWIRLLRAPSFPVAGTPVVTNSLYGTWRVEAHLSGSRRPCRTRFEIVR